MEEAAPRERRCFSSGDKNRHKESITELIRHLDVHSLIKRIGALHLHLDNSELDSNQLKEYNRLNNCIKDRMLSANKKLPKRKTSHWPPCLVKAVHNVHYTKMFLQRSSVLQCQGQQAETAWTSRDEHTIKGQLQEAHTELDEVLKMQKITKKSIFRS